MSDRLAAPVECASFTFARRHPKVLGRIGGWAPPVQLSFVQLATFTSAFAVLALSWDWWAPLLAPLLRLVVLVVVPSAAAWAVRRSRVEGRSLPRTAVGVLTWACRPSTGTLGDRPTPAPRVVDWCRHEAWIATRHASGRGGR